METKGQVHRDPQTIEEVINRAALECTEERERYLAVFTIGVEGYVCRNDSAMDESRALFKGHYSDCQVWIERRGIAAALQYVIEHLDEVPEFADRELAAGEILRFLAHRFQ